MEGEDEEEEGEVWMQSKQRRRGVMCNRREGRRENERE